MKIVHIRIKSQSLVSALLRLRVNEILVLHVNISQPQANRIRLRKSTETKSHELKFSGTASLFFSSIDYLSFTKSDSPRSQKRNKNMRIPVDKCSRSPSPQVCSDSTKGNPNSARTKPQHFFRFLIAFSSRLLPFDACLGFFSLHLAIVEQKSSHRNQVTVALLSIFFIGFSRTLVLVGGSESRSVLQLPLIDTKRTEISSSSGDTHP